MTTARVYRMEAAEGKADEFEAALREAAPVIRKVPGSLGIEILRDPENPQRFLFIEKWDSIESHKAAFDHLPPGTLDRLSAAMAGPPDGAYYDYVDTI